MFIACTFRPNDTRAYTFTYDGEEALAVGDIVLVANRSGEGTMQVHVVELDVAAPEFACKPILEKFVPPPAEQSDLLETGSEECA